MVKSLIIVLSLCLCYGWSTAELNVESHKYINMRPVNTKRSKQTINWGERQMLVSRGTSGEELSRTINQDGNQPAQYDDVVEFLRQQVEVQSHNTFGVCKPIFSCITYPSNIMSYLSSVKQHKIAKLGVYSTTPFPMLLLDTYNLYSTSSIELLQSKKISAYVLMYNDPFWRRQWYMQDYRTTDMPVKDLNVVPVHKNGRTGMGVTVAVVDDGVEHDHPELLDNFLADLSYDMCEDKPGSWPDKGKSHGTSCAGIIAMAANNQRCGVGIAFNAKIVGLKVICKIEQLESSIAKALTHQIDKIDIYSNSWEVNSKGRHIYEVDQLSKEAYRQGTTKGRQGKGAIYIRHSGYEKALGENCAVDSDINNPYVITIAGADQKGAQTANSERCAAVFATAYAANEDTEKIVAPRLKRGCTSEFADSAAVAPQAAGIIALVLEANPELSYRDVMHLITKSAEVAPLARNQESWYKNGRGFWVSNDFGFGLLNAENMVLLAKNWQNVPELHVCKMSIKLDNPAELTVVHSVEVPFQTTACEGTPDEINYVEHVEVTSNVFFPRRGNINVFLTSPYGTTSTLLETRSNDDTSKGFDGWSIVSTHNWGEDAKGKWTVTYKIADPMNPENVGHVYMVTLILYGTKTMPAHYAKNRRYAAFRFPNRRAYDE